MNIEEAQRKLLQLVDDKVKLKKELELYKKALELACSGNDYLVEYFIQKAWEE